MTGTRILQDKCLRLWLRCTTSAYNEVCLVPENIQHPAHGGSIGGSRGTSKVDSIPSCGTTLQVIDCVGDIFRCGCPDHP